MGTDYDVASVGMYIDPVLLNISWGGELEVDAEQDVGG
jgi:hypothetical protein